MKLTNRMIWEGFQGLFNICQMAGLKSSTLVWRLGLNKNHLYPAYEKLNATRLGLAKSLNATGLQRFSPDGKPVTLAEDERDALDAFDAAWHDVLSLESADATWKRAAAIKLELFKGCKEMPTPNDLAAIMALGIVEGEPAEGETEPKEKETGVV